MMRNTDDPLHIDKLNEKDSYVFCFLLIKFYLGCIGGIFCYFFKFTLHPTFPDTTIILSLVTFTGIFIFMLLLDWFYERYFTQAYLTYRSLICLVVLGKYPSRIILTLGMTYLYGSILYVGLLWINQHYPIGPIHEIPGKTLIRSHDDNYHTFEINSSLGVIGIPQQYFEVKAAQPVKLYVQRGIFATYVVKINLNGREIIR